MSSRDLYRLDPARLVDYILPALLPKLPTVLVRGASGAALPGGGGPLQAHDLAGPYHTGVLADGQGPHFLKIDGSRPLIGNLAVANGVTVDGVDLSAHVQDANAHHAQVHGIVSGNHTVTGAKWGLVGLTAIDALGLIAPASDVTGAVKEAVLKSNSSGELALTSMILSTGRLRSNATIEIMNAVGLAYQDVAARDIVANGSLTTGKGWVHSDSTVKVLTGASLAQRLMAGSIGVSSSYAAGEEAKVPANGIYSLGPIRGDTKLTTPKIDTLSGNLTIDPAAWTAFADNKDVRSVSHLSGFLGQGWRISWPEIDKPHLDIRSIYAETLEVTAFQADIMRVRIAEDFLTQGMAFTAEPFTTPSAVGGSVRVTFEDNPTFNGQLFLANEWVMFNVIQKRAGLVVAQVWGQMSAYQDEAASGGVGRQSWLFTLRSGATNFVIPKASTALAWGVSGQKNGYIHHNVLASAYGPWTRYATWSGANPYTVANRTYHLQTGNLRGLVDITGDRYGIAAGNNLAKTPTDAVTPFRGFTADNTGGLRLFNSAISSYVGTAQKFYLAPDGTEMWLGINDADKRFHYLNGDLTIRGTFEAGTGRFRAASDGVRIAVTDQSWADPFEVLSFRALALNGPEQAYIGVRSYNPTVNPVGSAWPNTAGTSTSADFQLALAAVGKSAGAWGSIALRAREGGQYTMDDTLGATLLVTPRNVWIGPNAGLRIASSTAELETPVPPGELYVNVIHATQVIADTLSGTEFAGAQWQYPGSVVIDAAGLADQTVTITNSMAGRADLVVDRNIIVGGAVDGIDVSAFYAAYAGHNHNHASLTGVTANQHHNQVHVLATAAGLGPDHTVSGLTAGHVLRAAGAAAAAFAQLQHADLGGISANQHHNQVHGILSADHSVVGNIFQLVGLVDANTLGLLTPSSSPGQTEALLKTDASGHVSPYLVVVTSGLIRSGNPFQFKTGDGSAFQQIRFESSVSNQGSYLTYADAHNFGDAATGARVRVGAGSLVISNDSAHANRVPANGIYSLGAIRGDAKLSTPLLDTLSGHMTVQPAADLLLSPGSGLVKLQSGVILQSHNYASQTTGVRVTGLGEGDFRYLYADEMYVKAFIADLEQALAGGQIISKSVTQLASSFTAPAAGATSTLHVLDLPSAQGMAVFQSGDIIRIREFSRVGGSLTASNCWGVVTNYANQNNGSQTWTFTRSASANAGAMATGTVIKKDSIILDYGVSGNGYYEVNAIDGAYALNSPYLQFVRWTGHPATGSVTRLRAGQLRGIFGQDEFGLFAGTGTANTDRWLRLSDYAPGNGLNNLPFRMYNGGTEVIHLGGWNDVWFGPSSADKRLHWNGAALAIAGQVTATSGKIAEWGIGVLDAYTLSATNLLISSGGAANARIEIGSGSNQAGLYAVTDDLDSVFWAGSSRANRFQATTPFRVTRKGKLYAVDAELKGVLTTNSGSVVIDTGILFSAGAAFDNYNTIRWKTGATGKQILYAGAADFSVQGFASVQGAYVLNDSSNPVLDADATNTFSSEAYYSQPASPRGATSILKATTKNMQAGTYVHGSVEVVAFSTGSTITVRGTYFKFNAHDVWHAGNLLNPLDRATFNGDFRSSANISFRNLAASAYVDIAAHHVTAAGDFWTTNGRIHSDNTIAMWNNANNSYQNFIANSVLSFSGHVTSDNTITFLNTQATAYQGIMAGWMTLVGGAIYSGGAISLLNGSSQAIQLRAGSVLASNDYSHNTRVPASGIYSLGPVNIGNAGVSASGFLLDVGGSALIRGLLRVDGVISLVGMTTIPAAVAGRMALWYDSVTGAVRTRLPDGTIRTLSWI